MKARQKPTVRDVRKVMRGGHLAQTALASAQTALAISKLISIPSVPPFYRVPL
jgi:hypothetical protein